MLAKEDEKCKNMKASRIIIFSAKHSNTEKRDEDTIPYYEEMAFGEFNIESEDKELIEAFEKIRDSIENQI